MTIVAAPAKINLTLEVLGKRDDGYHEIRSVMQTVSVADTLSFEISDSLDFRSDLPDWAAERSIVSQAATLLREMTSIDKGASVFVQKRIPLLSGLGGDSTDAAATLLGLNEIWELHLSRADLLPLARRLGSDVSFFLYGGTALATGRGETIVPLPPLPSLWLVLAMPATSREPGKTKQLYQSLRPNHYTDGAITQRFVRMLETTKQFDSSLLFNTFENVAFDRYPVLGTTKDHMQKIGAPNVHLAGSGPALFSVFADRAEAEQTYARLKGQRLEASLARTLSSSATML